MNNKQVKQVEVSKELDSSRRRVIKQLSVLFAGALSSNSIAFAMQGYQPKKSKNTRVTFFLNHDQLAQLKSIVDLILPETETPAASAVDVHGFIDSQLFHCFSSQEQSAFIHGLTRLNQIAYQAFRKLFIDSSSEQQTQLLMAMDTGEEDFTLQDRKFFYQLKSLTLLGYYTSEVGATQELAYLTIPGGYQGDVSFDSVGRAWAF